MLKICTALILTFTVSVASAEGNRKGYVLKSGKAEFAAGALIMASPSTGTQGGVLMQESFSEHFSTGLHYHVTADEFFYVLNGSGHVVLGEEHYSIGAGDVIFIPSGQDHKMYTDGSAMEVLVFLDQPGLEQEFRAWHREYGNASPQSLEQLNAISMKYGTLYKTIE